MAIYAQRIENLMLRTSLGNRPFMCFEIFESDEGQDIYYKLFRGDIFTFPTPVAQNFVNNTTGVVNTVWGSEVGEYTFEIYGVNHNATVKGTVAAGPPKQLGMTTINYPSDGVVTLQFNVNPVVYSGFFQIPLLPVFIKYGDRYRISYARVNCYYNGNTSELVGYIPPVSGVFGSCSVEYKSDFNFTVSLSASGVTLENYYTVGTDLVGNAVPDDPYAPGGDSGEGGGGGEQNFDPDVITPTPLPTFSFADSGFCRIYKPTLTELRALANYMWTDDDFLTTVLNHAKQLLEDPMESVISFSLVPVVPPTSTPESVKVLFIPITGVTMAPVTNQFVEVDCGTLSFAKEDGYGSALDFNPYTTIDLYLPFIGQVTLDTDEVMYKTIKCKYNVDVVTGMCVASISVMTDLGESVLYQYAGHCGVQMPLTSADFSGYVGAIIGATKMVAGLAAAGAGAPAIGAGIVGGPTPQTSTTVTHREPDVTTIGGVSSRVTARNPATGRQVTAGTSERAPLDITRTYGDRTSQYSTSPPSFGELATKGAVNTVDAVMGGKMIIQHSGGFTGNSGFIAGVTYPYAIIKRPRQCRPANYAKYHGYPSMIYMNLGSVSGYTEVNEIHLEGMSATNPELGEIAMLLKSGVIL